MVVGAFIVKVSYDLISRGIGELMEKSLPDEVEDEILRIAASEPDVIEPHDLKTRRIGNRYAIELHILMNGDITLTKAHDHADSIENQLKKRFGENTHVAIHMEPKETENPT
jgi:divalent metal cation (Fe/Co/Zn/Cd) transporter